jgi:putative FmdB family regulatory protein
MPIYEYVCGKCGENLEVTQRMADPPLKTHKIESSCGGPLKKIISMNSFHLKGTGWYKTDYAKPSPTASSDVSSNSSGTSEAKKETAKDGAESKSSTTESSPASTTATTTPKTGGGTD